MIQCDYGVSIFSRLLGEIISWYLPRDTEEQVSQKARTHLLVAVYGSTRDEAEEMKLWGFIGVIWRLFLSLVLNPVGAKANY